MVVSIPIRIVLSYDFMILPQPTDTYRDGILIWYSLRLTLLFANTDVSRYIHISEEYYGSEGVVS
jgi:hypothetical protein